jgi:hypothetical protein
MSNLLDFVLEANGGLDRWRNVDSVDVRISMNGPLAVIKQQPDGLRDVLVRVDARQPRTRISPYRHKGQRGFFEPGRVWIEDTQGQLLSELRDPRSSFDSQNRMSPWTDLQFLYFVGYAYRGYFTTPYLLTENRVEVREERPHEENGEQWRVLDVTFPPSLDVHTARQKFYFDERGYLVRNDYATDVARGTVAHYLFDQQVFDGFVFATRRRVVLRDGDRPLIHAPSVFHLEISDVLVNRKGA